MATLVLTTVGGAIGGPVGAALGAIAGQAVDRRVLAPRGREGPRLSELKVQTSRVGPISEPKSPILASLLDDRGKMPLFLSNTAEAAPISRMSCV
jgi:hypothetical protein